MRDTGGNRFIPEDATSIDLVLAVQQGLNDLAEWALGTDRVLDLGEISVETKRIPNGNISVMVTADLKDKTDGS